MDDELEREARRQFALSECERTAREAAQARSEMGADIVRRTMALPERDPMEQWRADAAAREEVGRRARAELRAAERREVEQASVAAIEARIVERFEQRIGEEVLRIFSTLNKTIMPCPERVSDRLDAADKIVERHEARLAEAFAHVLARDGVEIIPPAPGPKPRPRRRSRWRASCFNMLATTTGMGSVHGTR